ncbi:MAG: hypothetical protein ACTHK8_14205 [Ginsengibacter sp.]
MSNRLTWFEKINVANIALTLILSVIAVILAYNSYKISENTYILSKQVEQLSTAQAEVEFKSSIFTLFTTIDMQRQNDSEGKNLEKCIETLKEMKSILEGQMTNSYLAQHDDLSNLWVELDGQINYDIKFLGEGLKPHTTVAGVKQILVEVEKQTGVIFDKFLEKDTKLIK